MLSFADVHGVLVGGANLHAESFPEICVGSGGGSDAVGT
nr:hypothetical protein [Rhizobium leguminosarum]